MDVKLVGEVIDELSDLFTMFPESVKKLQGKLKAAIAPPPKFYKGQQGLASNDGICWHSTVLLNITKAGFVCGRVDGGKSPWHHFKPSPDAVTLPVWRPMSEVAKDKMFDLMEDASVAISADETMYTIIPPYEVLS